MKKPCTACKIWENLNYGMRKPLRAERYHLCESTVESDNVLSILFLALCLDAKATYCGVAPFTTQDFSLNELRENIQPQVLALSENRLNDAPKQPSCQQAMQWCRRICSTRYTTSR